MPAACLVELVLGDQVHQSGHIVQVEPSAVNSQDLAASADMPRANIHQVSAVFAPLS